ncbi:MAG: hypothetical protein QNJ60_17295 [Xenococcaceae cyanobacterium MO_188.B19]|nr:hypothetical protein [Xenococcaceae cyanobacterium MO_188.B19]
MKQALSQWQNHPEGNNNLVILFSPVAQPNNVIQESLSNLESDNLLHIQSLSSQASIHDYRQITKQLTSKLDTPEIAPLTELNSLLQEVTGTEDKHKISIIPRLEWCLLRCIGGLAAIEVLRDAISHDNSCFWLIGCNSWAWEYLDKVYQISAYLNNTDPIALLDESQMQEWLEPLNTKIDLVWKADNEWLSLKPEASKKESQADQELDEVAKIKKAYYSKLTDLSQGISNIASDLWWRSLNYEQVDDESKKYTITKPKLPEMPNLIATDRYILYSLLLHSGMTLAHLKTTLETNESIVKNRTQYLLQNGVINKEQNFLSVNPAYYLQLKTLLSNNNFLTN